MGKAKKTLAFLAVPGQLVLIELADAADERCLTGLVLDGSGPLVVDLGASPRPDQPECEVLASIFDPEALYRLAATARARAGAPSVLELDVHSVEKVQRRSDRRSRVAYPVALTAFDGPGDFVSVVGQTMDLSAGGCRVTTPSPFPTTAHPTVCIRLPEDDPVVALGQVLGLHVEGSSYEYRLAFRRIADDDVERINALTG